MRAADIEKAIEDGAVLAYRPNLRHSPRAVRVLHPSRFGGEWRVVDAHTGEVVRKSGWPYVSSRALIGPYDEAHIEWLNEQEQQAMEKEQQEVARLARCVNAQEAVEHIVQAVPNLTPGSIAVSHEGLQIIINLSTEGKLA